MSWYKSGSVTVTNGQTSVTGTDTKFAANARVGDGFRGPDGKWYEIVNIASDTVLGTYPAYQGATEASSADYMIAPLQGYNKDSADRLRSITDGLRGIEDELAEVKENADKAKVSETNAQASELATSQYKDDAKASSDAALTYKDSAESARDEAVEAVSSISGVFIDLGTVDLSSGSYPPKPTTTSLWQVSVGGTVSGTLYAVGDILIYSKPVDKFYRIPGASAGVTSVAGKTGAVTLVKSDVGLPNVDNTSDANKPVSSATQTALNTKVDKVSGKQLSTEDYTTAEKSKLTAVEAGATKNSTDTFLVNRANHTGTQLASTISDLSQAVRLTTLTGYAPVNSTVVASDSILAAMGKLQGQVSVTLPLSNTVVDIQGSSIPRFKASAQFGGSVSLRKEDLSDPDSAFQIRLLHQSNGNFYIIDDARTNVRAQFNVDKSFQAYGTVTGIGSVISQAVAPSQNANLWLYDDLSRTRGVIYAGADNIVRLRGGPGPNTVNVRPDGWLEVDRSAGIGFGIGNIQGSNMDIAGPYYNGGLIGHLRQLDLTAKLTPVVLSTAAVANGTVLTLADDAFNYESFVATSYAGGATRASLSGLRELAAAPVNTKQFITYVGNAYIIAYFSDTDTSQRRRLVFETFSTGISGFTGLTGYKKVALTPL